MDNDASNQKPPQSVASWFQSVDNATPTPPPPSPLKKHKKLLIAAGVVSVFFGAGSIILAIMNSTKPCLTASDYTELTGATISATSLSPTTNFYTTYIDFTPKATTYDGTDDQGEDLVTKIAKFYTSHSASSITITIKGSYLTKDAQDITQQQVDTVKGTLITNGVPASVIATPDLQYIIPEESTPDDPSSILISITSNEKCS